MKRIALAGNPNSGKTTLFNSLTGSTAHVGNWPGVTVDKREGKYKKGSEVVDIIDLPGIYSLSPYTDEEVIARNYIIDEKPDCIINVVDVTNLERNLYLTTQLLEMDVPVVVALNMTDTLKKDGGYVDTEKLSKELGVPVVSVSALKEENLPQLMNVAIDEASKQREGKSVLANSKVAKVIEKLQEEYKKFNISNSLFRALKICEKDELEAKAHPELLELVEKEAEQLNDEVFGNDIEAIVADERYKYINSHYSNALTKGQKEENKEQKSKFSLSDKIDKILTNRIFGLIIFAAIIFLIFHFTFSEDLLYLNAMGAFGEDGLVSFAGNEVWEGLFANGGINSIGVFFQSLLGIGTDAIGNAITEGLASVNAPEWVNGLLVDGIWGGVASVLSFLPQILLLFLFFAILEDTGYMARVAFILDRLFRKFGLSGRAFIPMIMGFGCSIPAMINTRTLADDREKIATIRVIPFFSCGAKLPILAAFAGCIAEMFNAGNADAISFGFYMLGMLAAIVTVILMRTTSLRGPVSPFIMELPPYHLPQLKSLAIHLWDKAKHFVKKAFTIILLSTILIWFLSHFTWNWTYVADEQMNESILAGLGMLVQPLLTPAGFGSQLGQYGWVFAVAAVTGLIAKENCIATLGVLAACVIAMTGSDPSIVIDVEGATDVATLAYVTGATVPTLLSYVTFNMLTIPCFAAVATAKAELPKHKFWTTIGFWLLVSYVASTIVYCVGSWYWTIFIVLAVAALVVVCIYLYNKKYPVKAE